MQRAYRKLWLVNLVCYRVHETDGGVGKKERWSTTMGTQQTSYLILGSTTQVYASRKKIIVIV